MLKTKIKDKTDLKTRAAAFVKEADEGNWRAATTITHYVSLQPENRTEWMQVVVEAAVGKPY